MSAPTHGYDPDDPEDDDLMPRARAAGQHRAEDRDDYERATGIVRAALVGLEVPARRHRRPVRPETLVALVLLFAVLAAAAILAGLLWPMR